MVLGRCKIWRSDEIEMFGLFRGPVGEVGRRHHLMHYSWVRFRAWVSRLVSLILCNFVKQIVLAHGEKLPKCPWAKGGIPIRLDAIKGGKNQSGYVCIFTRVERISEQYVCLPEMPWIRPHLATCNTLAFVISASYAYHVGLTYRKEGRLKIPDDNNVGIWPLTAY